MWRSPHRCRNTTGLFCGGGRWHGLQQHVTAGSPLRARKNDFNGNRKRNAGGNGTLPACRGAGCPIGSCAVLSSGPSESRRRMIAGDTPRRLAGGCGPMTADVAHDPSRRNDGTALRPPGPVHARHSPPFYDPAVPRPMGRTSGAWMSAAAGGRSSLRSGTTGRHEDQRVEHGQCRVARCPEVIR